MPSLFRSLAVALVFIGGASFSEAAQYTYDSLGRVTQVTEPDGSSLQYTYDASGNVTSITRTGGSISLAISSFSPNSGPIGTSVTISGIGFSNASNQNTVTFNGVTAVVTSATANTLVVTVPTGATSGTISVTTAAGTTASASPFIVTSVSITSVSPVIGPVGTLVTIAGTGFDPTPSGNSIRFNTTSGIVQSASPTQLTATVPSGATSGRIQVTTSSGSALSASDFIVPPPGYVAGDVALAGHLTPGGYGLIYTIGTANKLGAAFFDGLQGQRITMLLTNVSLGGTYKIYAPDGTLFASGNIANNFVLDLPPLPATGTYSIYLAPGTALGSATVKVVADVTGVIATNGTPTMLAMSAGQNGSLSFNGAAGQSFNLLLTGVTSAPSGGSLAVRVLLPDGSTLTDCTNTAINNNCRFVLSAAGTYQVRLDPSALYAMSFAVRLNQDLTGTLAAGTPFSVNLTAIGQQALLNFTATAGQTFAVYLGSIATSPAGKTMYATVYNAAGTQIATAGSGAGYTTLNLPTLAAGTYSVLIKPLDGATATMQVTLAAGLTGTLSSNGTSSSYGATMPGQYGYFTFSATAGESLGLAITSLALTPGSSSYTYVEVDQPNGALLNAFYTYTSSIPGDQLSLRNLPATGTYKVIVAPPAASVASFVLTVSHDVSGTLTTGTPLSVNLTVPGHHALLNFTATAGQTFALNVGSTVTTPAGKAMYVTVYNAAGTTVGSASGSSGNVTLNLLNLAAGTYSVLLEVAQAATATTQVTLASGLTGTLPSDGTSSTFSSSVPGQNGYFTFSATAGDNLALATTNLALTPASSSYTYVAVYLPSGSLLNAFYAYSSSVPGDQLSLRNLPATGTYSVVVSPPVQSAMSFALTLSRDVSGTLTAGTPISVGLGVPGQHGLLSFTATAGQTLTLNVASIVTTPSGKATYVTVYNAAGGAVGSAANSSGSVTVNLPSLAAGTYSVLIEVYNAATATMQASIQ